MEYTRKKMAAKRHNVDLTVVFYRKLCMDKDRVNVLIASILGL